MNYDVIVIGGGVAGLSAAVHLASRGVRPLVLEQKPHLGGRTYSFIDKKTGDIVDNGQHLLMGCYHETIRYLDLIGSSHLAKLQPGLHIDFLHPTHGSASLRCPPIPAPFHALVGLLGLKSLSIKDRLLLLKVGSSLVFGLNEEALAQMTVDEWLRRLGQTAKSRKYLWDIIAIGTLNDDPKNVSALLFYRVLRAAFLGRRKNSSLLIPRVGLSELLVNPAVEFIRQRAGEVQTGVQVNRLDIEGKTIRAVWAKRKKLQARSYISAVPWYALTPLFPAFATATTGRRFSLLPPAHPSTNPADALLGFESSPIMTINLWFDRPVMDQEFTAVLDCRIQWIFNRTKMIGQKGDRHYLSLVVSGAKEYLSWSSRRIVEVALKELKQILPLVRGATLFHSLVVKEKRATFSPKPDVEALRPGAETEWENLFLAGDWTDTGYPATIEGAVLSGRNAAEKLS